MRSVTGSPHLFSFTAPPPDSNLASNSSAACLLAGVLWLSYKKGFSLFDRHSSLCPFGIPPSPGPRKTPRLPLTRDAKKDPDFPPTAHFQEKLCSLALLAKIRVEDDCTSRVHVPQHSQLLLAIVLTRF